MEYIDDENDSEKFRNPKEKCVLIFTCSYCGSKINTIKINLKGSSTSKEIEKVIPKNKNDDICQECKRNLAKCSVCQCPIKLKKNLNNQAFIYCTKCSHGGHYDHYQGWFKEFNECPNSRCNCRCQEDNIKNLLANSLE